MDDEDDMFGEEYVPMDPDEEEDITIISEANPVAEQVNEEEHKEKEIEKKPEEIVEKSVPKEIFLSDDFIPSSQLPSSGEFVSVHGACGTVYLQARVPTLCVEAEPPIGGSCFANLLAESIESLRVRDADLATWLARQDNGPRSSHQQFVDKYKPSRFIDLLSDDSVNRQVMMWLSEWKKNLHSSVPFATISPPVEVVLSAPPVAPPSVPQRGLDRPKSQWEGPGQKWVKPDAPTVSASVVLPNKKILLIGGAPGVGKSTLIEICAKHFNYSIIESSSADERGKTHMAKVITDVSSNRSVLDSTKPQLLLIEEVDGEECSAADLLVDLVHKHPELIKRPIICVCTDVWNKRLRNLREVSTVISLPPPKSLRLSEKLKQICGAEKILIESMAIDRLVSLCDCDIRACLNQLQTLAALAASDVATTVADVMKYCSLDFGQAALKDTQKSELELMQLIFEPKRSRLPKYSLAVNTAINAAKNLSAHLLEIFAHCLVTIPFTDFNFRYMQKLAEWISFENCAPSAASGMAMRFASAFCPAVGKPRVDVMGARKLLALRFHSHNDRETIVNALRKSALHSVPASRFLSARFAHYSAKLLLAILEPEYNPTWVKKSVVVHPEIARIAKVYAQFGLQLVAEEDKLQLVPDLHVLGNHSLGYPVGSAMGELLRTEAQAELLKQRAAHDGAAELVAKGVSKRPANIDNDDACKKARLNLSNWAGKTTQHHTDGSDVILVKKFPFEFKFNEGHTNAVRRVLRLKDFTNIVIT